MACRESGPSSPRWGLGSIHQIIRRAFPFDFRQKQQQQPRIPRKDLHGLTRRNAVILRFFLR